MARHCPEIRRRQPSVHLSCPTVAECVWPSPAVDVAFSAQTRPVSPHPPSQQYRYAQSELGPAPLRRVRSGHKPSCALWVPHQAGAQRGAKAYSTSSSAGIRLRLFYMATGLDRHPRLDDPHPSRYRAPFMPTWRKPAGRFKEADLTIAARMKRSAVRQEPAPRLQFYERWADRGESSHHRRLHALVCVR